MLDMSLEQIFIRPLESLHGTPWKVFRLRQGSERDSLANRRRRPRCQP